jgi:hypothetical protein
LSFHQFGGLFSRSKSKNLPEVPGLVIIQKAIENGPVEIVDLPRYKMVVFHSYVDLPEGASNQSN